MKLQSIKYFCIVLFSIFIGSQITEGALLVPYWQALSASEFYAYYHDFGPTIGRFYTILTIIAALIPIGFVGYYWFKKQTTALKFTLMASFFALLFVASFYVYFKGTNALFYQAALSDIELQKELITWSYWHWSRILTEIISLLFLIRAFADNKAQK